MGDSGTGKSALIRQILCQLEQRGETAIVYDPALEYTGQFYTPERGDVILNPLDARSPFLESGRRVAARGRNADAGDVALSRSPPREHVLHRRRRGASSRICSRCGRRPQELAFVVVP